MEDQNEKYRMLNSLWEGMRMSKVGVKFNTKEILNLFHQCKLPNQFPFLKEMIAKGAVVKHNEKGSKIYYTIENRIEWHQLKACIKDFYHKKSLAATAARLSKASGHKVVHCPKVEKPVFTEEDAIKFLKATGNYIIQRRVVTYEEI